MQGGVGRYCKKLGDSKSEGMQVCDAMKMEIGDTMEFTKNQDNLKFLKNS